MSRGNLYSRLVGWLKILLPLAALGILSSVVFFARDSEDHRTIPFVTLEGGPDTSAERVTAPEYVALTGDDASVTLRAQHVNPVAGNSQILDAFVVRGTLASRDGRIVNARAPEARIDMVSDVAQFTGEVHVETSDGYVVLAPDLRTRLDVSLAESDGPVSGRAPYGTLEAGAFRYTAPPEGETSVLLFHGGVKLVYEPQNERDDE